MFGDFEADMDAPLSGYARKLTGVKLHLENSGGDLHHVSPAHDPIPRLRATFSRPAAWESCDSPVRKSCRARKS